MVALKTPKFSNRPSLTEAVGLVTSLDAKAHRREENEAILQEDVGRFKSSDASNIDALLGKGHKENVIYLKKYFRAT